MRPPIGLVVAAIFVVEGGARADMDRTLFVNRHGGEYFPGPVDDSAANITPLISEPRTALAFGHYDDDWQEVMVCLRDLFEPFSIEVTDVEPTSGNYMEAVVGGRPTDLGYGQTVGGVGPSSCFPVERGISFTFDSYGSMRGLCQAVAHEVGHTLGLEHVILCNDIMSYGECIKEFVDLDSACGEVEARPCTCRGPTQNSAEYLLTIVGVVDLGPPDVVITFPVGGDQVAPGFSMAALAEDDTDVIRVDFEIDGLRVASVAEAPWLALAPRDLAPGWHSVRVLAVDSLGKENAAEIQVEVVGPPTGGIEVAEGAGACAVAGHGRAPWVVLLLFGCHRARRRRHRG